MIDPGDFCDDALAKIAPPCGECPDGGNVVITAGEAIYPHRADLWINPDGSKRWWWRCRRCFAYCGVHAGTLKALGTPAGITTRRAREAAHAAFDPMWEKRVRLSGLSKSVAWGRGYKWLAVQLGIPAKDCHIGQMDAATARRVVEVVAALKPTDAVTSTPAT